MWAWPERWVWPEGAWPRGHVTALDQSEFRSQNYPNPTTTTTGCVNRSLTSTGCCDNQPYLCFSTKTQINSKANVFNAPMHVNVTVYIDTYFIVCGIVASVDTNYVVGLLTDSDRSAQTSVTASYLLPHNVFGSTGNRLFFILLYGHI